MNGMNMKTIRRVFHGVFRKECGVVTVMQGRRFLLLLPHEQRSVRGDPEAAPTRRRGFALQHFLKRYIPAFLIEELVCMVAFAAETRIA